MNDSLRPCYISCGKGDKIKGLFHCFVTESTIVEPSSRVGGHPGGVLTYTNAIVELKNGSVLRVDPSTVQFVDNMVYKYEWPMKGEQNE